MINVKDIIYEDLANVLSNVSDSYPQQWTNLPAVQYVEEENKVEEYTDNMEQLSYIRYRIDIWDTKSTSATACAIDAVMSGRGFLRISCSDVPDPSGLKHKQMRYEAIIDCEMQSIYHT